MNLEEIRTELAQRRLHDFVRQAWHVIEPGRKFVDNWHVGAICEHLEAVTRRQIKRLVINVPFRTSKSTIVSVMWPAWTWLQDPKHQWLTLSHGGDLAIRDALKHRVLIESPWYRERWGDRFGLAPDQNQKQRFENTERGYRVARGFDSRLTGEGGDTILIDDPHDRDSAHSDLERAAALITYDQKVSNRLNDPERGAIVIIMQRLHEQDLSGHVLAQGGWDHLMLPMRFEAKRRSSTSIGWTDPRKVEGELMWPERFSEPVVKALEKTLGAYGAAGQLQQRPSPEGGGKIKAEFIRKVQALPAGLELCRGWDFAATEGGGDWSVGGKVGISPDKRIFICDVVRLQGSDLQVDLALEAAADQDGAGVRISIPQDPGAAGKASANARVRLLAGYTVGMTPETGSKTDRARAFGSQVEAGNVYMLDAPWNDDLINEFKSFPNGAHDDQVDAIARAFNAIFDPRTDGLLKFMEAMHAAAQPIPPGQVVMLAKAGVGTYFDRLGRVWNADANGRLVVPEDAADDLRLAGCTQVQ